MRVSHRGARTRKRGGIFKHMNKERFEEVVGRGNRKAVPTQKKDKRAKRKKSKENFS